MSRYLSRIISHAYGSSANPCNSEALNQEWGLGREVFKDKIERMSKRQVRPSQPGRPRVEEEQAVYYVR
jgi:hypothetical protein